MSSNRTKGRTIVAALGLAMACGDEGAAKRAPPIGESSDGALDGGAGGQPGFDAGRERGGTTSRDAGRGGTAPLDAATDAFHSFDGSPPAEGGARDGGVPDAQTILDGGTAVGAGGWPALCGPMVATQAESSGLCGFMLPLACCGGVLDTDRIALAFSTMTGPATQLPRVASHAACAASGNVGWYLDDATSSAQLCSGTCADLHPTSSDTGPGGRGGRGTPPLPPAVEWLLGGVPCSNYDAGPTPPAEQLARVAHMAPDLPALRVCARAVGSADPWKDLTIDPTVNPLCGNGVLDPGELCDGSDLGGLTCATYTSGTFTLGSLACSYSCTIDYYACRSAGTGGAPGTGGGPSGPGRDAGVPREGGVGSGGTNAADASVPNEAGGARGLEGGAPPPLPPFPVPPPSPPPPRSIRDGLDYQEVSAYVTVSGLDEVVRVLPWSASCDGTPLSETTLHFASGRTTLLVTGQMQSPRVLPLDDGTDAAFTAAPTGQFGQNDAVRLVDAMESEPRLDGFLELAAPLSSTRTFVSSFPNTTFTAGVSSAPQPAGPVAGYEQSPVISFVTTFPTLQASLRLSLVDGFTGAPLGTFDGPAPNTATSAFVAGTSSADLTVIECTDSPASSVYGLSPCTAMSRAGSGATSPVLTFALLNASTNVGAVEVCARSSTATAFDDSQKAPFSIGYGESGVSYSVDSGTTTLRVVARGTPCSGSPLAEAVLTGTNTVFGLAGLRSPGVSEPPLRLIALNPYQSFTPGDAGLPLLSAVTVVHAAIGLGAVDVAAVTAGRLSQPSWPGLAFGSTATAVFDPLASLAFGVAPLVSFVPTHVASVPVATTSQHAYVAWLAGANGSQQDPLVVWFCDQTPPFSSGSLSCTVVPLSP